MEHVAPYYQLVVRREGFKDTLEVKVELADNSLLEKWQQLAALEAGIRQNLHSAMGLDAKVCLVGYKTLLRKRGKSKRVLYL